MMGQGVLTLILLNPRKCGAVVSKNPGSWMTFTSNFYVLPLIFVVSTFYSVFSKLPHCEKRKMPLTMFQVR